MTTRPLPVMVIIHVTKEENRKMLQDPDLRKHPDTRKRINKVHKSCRELNLSIGGTIVRTCEK